MRLEVTKIPDLRRWYDVIRQEVVRGLHNGAQDIIDDNCERIDQRIDFEGQPQKPNSAAYLDWKTGAGGKEPWFIAAAGLGGMSPPGHDVPLRLTDTLRDPAAYEIDGAPASSPAQRLDRVPMLVTVSLPESRRAVVGYLRDKGYSYWGISREARQRVIDRVRFGLGLAKQRIEAEKAQA